MKIELILVMVFMLIPVGITSSKDITPDGIIAGGNVTIINESDPVYWFNKGEALLNFSEYNESIEAFNKAIELVSRQY